MSQNTTDMEIDEAGSAGEVDRSEVKSLRKALAILNVISTAEFPLSIAGVAQQARVTRPTAYRIVQTLLNEGFVYEDPVSGKMSIGYSALPLAASVLDRDRLRMEAVPHLEELARVMGERVNLATLYKDQVLYLAGIEKPNLPSIYSRFGRVVPAHCSSLGKAILAYYPEAEVLKMLERVPLFAQTPHSIVSLPAFLEELRLTRERGFAIDREENTIGAFCIGTAIFAKNVPVGAISVSARSLESIERQSERVLSAAEQISHKM